jgi:hypothetical protein
VVGANLHALARLFYPRWKLAVGEREQADHQRCRGHTCTGDMQRLLELPIAVVQSARPAVFFSSMLAPDYAS